MHNFTSHDSARSPEREVTLLFADLRASTELAAALAIEPLAYEMFGHVLDCLTEAVLDHSGFVVDYYGDGLMAMWNAPIEATEHAILACRAAFQMRERLPEVAADWISLTQSDFRLGVGVHTGTVHVGNAGSTLQAKYGPRGPNVHVARRVEAATKELGLPLLATQPTVQQLSGRFAANRVCRARLPGWCEPVALFAIRCGQSDKQTSEAWQLYDAALIAFEQGRYHEAADILAAINLAIVDVPSHFLAAQTGNQLGRKQRRRSTDGAADHSPGIITLSAK